MLRTIRSFSRPWMFFLAVPVTLATLWLSGPYVPVGGKIIGRGASTEKAVALTFDDGPNAAYTGRIMDILDKYDAKGTFFVVGANVKRHPEVAREIVARGHEIGNHSYSHSNFLPYRSPEEIQGEYKSAEQAILNATGVAPRFYRAPHGKVTPWMRWELGQQKMEMVGWSYSPRDWENPGAQNIVDRVLSAARPGGIILLHDGLDLNESPDKSQLLQALPLIIEGLQAKGYKLVTVAELLGQAPYFQGTPSTQVVSR